MALYYVGFFFVTLMVLAYQFPQMKLSPSLYGLYAFTSFLLGLLRYSNLKLFFIVRYFFYVITGFIIAWVPVLLILMAVLILMRLVLNNDNRLQQILNLFIVLGFLIITVLTIWGGMTFGQENLNSLIDIYSLISMYFICSFISFILWNWLIRFWPKTMPVQTIIILGMAIDREDHLPHSLAMRLNKAIDIYLKQVQRYHDYPQIIVTGGTGGNALESEASMMRHYLIAQGIPSNQIVVEDDALNTDENLKLSSELIEQFHLQKPVMVVTSGYHLMRTDYLARKIGLEAEFMGTYSSLFFWPYYIVREYLAYVTLTKGWNFIYIIFLIFYGYFL